MDERNSGVTSEYEANMKSGVSSFSNIICKKYAFR